MSQSTFSEKLIAPCGMNCGICRMHLREKNPCPGCRFIDPKKPKTRQSCKIKLCKKRKGEFCCNCAEFPCDLLKRLDARYQKKYGMSEIENLKCIKEHGMKAFLANEEKKRVCPKGIVCVHDRKVYKVKSKDDLK